MKKNRIFRWLILFLAGCGVVSSPVLGTYLEKKFVVCRDRGQDVLCDPYIVKENDSVLKVFREKGEIASKDLSWFLEMFKRLNPEIKDINLIFPNQRILVPLKVIAPGTLEGQESGVVSIPLITITNIPVKIQGKSTQYIVAEGDSVSKLLARQFGASSGRSYREAVELFKFLNPDIKNLDKIRVGQKINLPVAAIKEESWYPGIFDESGRLVVTEEAAAKAAPVEAPKQAMPPLEKIEPLDMPPPLEMADLPELSELPQIPPLAAVEPLPEKLELAELPEIEALPEISQPEPAPQIIQPQEQKKAKTPEAVALSHQAASSPPEKPAPVITTKTYASGPSIFKRAATILGAELLDQGEYYFPRKGFKDLKLDLSVTPVMEFDSGRKALLVQGNALSPADQEVIHSYWTNLMVVNIPDSADVRDLLTPLCPMIHRGGCENKIMFDDHGITVTVQGEYIFDKENEPGKTCLTLIDIEDQKTPNSFQLYLASMMIDISEWIDSGSYFGPVQRYHFPYPSPPTMAALGGRQSPQEFVRNFALVFGCKYDEQLEISFDYAGFQVKTLSNMLTAAPGNEILVDFGDFQGDAVKSVESTGFRVVQLKPTDDGLSMLKKLLQGLSLGFRENPTFWAAERRKIHNSSFQVPGLLIEYAGDPNDLATLVSFVPVNMHLIAFLNQSGIRVIQLIP